MRRRIILAALGLAIGAFALEWLEYRYLARAFSTEIYIVVLALGFTALGLWAGLRLARAPAPEKFERNDAAVKSLGVTVRELDVLERLADGQTNKEIACSLNVSPNTVKSHLARLYEKLGVSRRTQALNKARELALIP